MLTEFEIGVRIVLELILVAYISYKFAKER